MADYRLAGTVVNTGRLLLLLAVLLPTALANAAETGDAIGEAVYDRSWQITTYASEAGLTHQRVFDIAFEKDGTVWLAASDGLRRYDGYGWSRFDTNAGLPSSFMRSVLLTKRGELWVGSDAGTGVFDPQRKSYETHGSTQGLAGPNVRQIAEDPDGTLWFSCDQWPDTSAGKGGLTSYREGQWSSYHRQNGLPMDYVIHYFRTSDGRRFAMTPRGWVERQGERWDLPQNPGYEAESCILSMAEGPGGRLFAQGENQLLVLLDDRWQTLGRETALIGVSRENEVIAVGRDSSRGQLWFEVWDGVRFVRRSSTISYPPEGRLYKVSQAPDGSIWCVGYGTVMRWEYRMGQWDFHPRLPAPTLCDSQGRVWFSGQSNVVVHQPDGFQRLSGLRQLLAVSKAGVAYGLGQVTEDLVCARPESAAAFQAVNWGANRLQFMATEADGSLWAMGKNASNATVISRLDGGNWLPIASPALRDQGIQNVTADPQQGIWVILRPSQAVDYELAHVVSNRFEPLTFASQRPPLTYPTFLSAAESQWLYGYSGLFQRSLTPPGLWQAVGAVPENGFHQSLAGKDEVLFLFGGARGGQPGCALYRHGQWRVQHGSFNRAFLGRDKQTLFLSTRGGVFIRREPGTLEMEFLPLPADVFVGGIVQDQDGTLWIGASDGVFHYHQDKVPPDTTISASLTEVRQNVGLPVTFGGIKRFAPVNPPVAFRYSWRFDDAAWSSFTNWPGHQMPLPAITPGAHRLEVKARDADGNLDPTPVTLSFTVLPSPLQQRAWFKPVVGLLLALIAFLSWVGVTRSRQIAQRNEALGREIDVRRGAEAELQKTQDELEHRVAERTAELSQANVFLSHEITERKQAEEHQHLLEEQLRQAHKMRAIGTLAGGIAHDFNNLLTAIIPFTQLAMDEASDNPKVQDHLSQVLQAAERAKNLVQQILAFSRQQKTARRVVDLPSVIQEALTLLRRTLPATVEISLQIESKLPPVFADPSQIHQVLINLCTNAEHAMHDRKGHLDIRLKLVTVDQAFARFNPDLKIGPHLRLSVGDNGKGMSEEVQKRIFEPFFTTKGPGRGTGLGLSVVHGIVKDHDGAILVHSQPDKGSQFDIYLPIYQGDAAPVAETVKDRTPRGHGQHILVVDDEPSLCMVLELMLKRQAYRVTTYTNSIAALQAVRENPTAFDLVLTDLSMPGLTGLEVAKALLEIRPNLPVLLATGFGGVWTPETERIANIRKCLFKPINADVLYDAVNEVLNTEADSGV